MQNTAAITDANPTVAEMEACVARFARLRPTDDYADAAIPGCERTTYRVLGTPPAAPLAAEHFHLNIVSCEPGKAAPLTTGCGTLCASRTTTPTCGSGTSAEATAAVTPGCGTA